jgi:hypothetical protein
MQYLPEATNLSAPVTFVVAWRPGVEPLSLEAVAQWLRFWDGSAVPAADVSTATLVAAAGGIAGTFTPLRAATVGDVQRAWIAHWGDQSLVLFTLSNTWEADGLGGLANELFGRIEDHNDTDCLWMGLLPTTTRLWPLWVAAAVAGGVLVLREVRR